MKLPTREETQAHLDNPEVGDTYQEMFSYWAHVLEVTPTHVTIACTFANGIGCEKRYADRMKALGQNADKSTRCHVCDLVIDTLTREDFATFTWTDFDKNNDVTGWREAIDATTALIVMDYILQGVPREVAA